MQLRFSRKVKAINYDHERSSLHIVFDSGIVKRYGYVPENLYEELKKTGDPTEFWKDKIDMHFIVL